MSTSNTSSRIIIAILILIIVVLLILYLKCCDQKTHEYEITEKKDGKVSWNILFKPGTNEASRNETIAEIEEYVLAVYKEYNDNNGTDYKPDSQAVSFCPCDTLIYNLGFGSINAAGESVTTTPTRPTRVPGSGDNLAYQVSENVPAKDRIDSVSITGKNTPNYIVFDTIDHSRRLAIIDSGIDSTLFNEQLANLIWSDPAGNTLKNFLPGNKTNSYFDSTKNKHGSSVAAIILRNLATGNAASELMILKALNDSGVGSIFSVTCALSYARQKNATIINMSLGYYGAADSILHHYLKLCDSVAPAIEVFAAAGNTEDDHKKDTTCFVGNNQNQLAFGRLFYPGCFSTDLNYFTTVTQINNGRDPCFYQNYSDKYVTLGVFDTNYCCATYTGFMGGGYAFHEGSSFVTPIASGLRMLTRIKGGDGAVGQTLWNNMIHTTPPPAKATVGGRYIEYSIRQ